MAGQDPPAESESIERDPRQMETGAKGKRSKRLREERKASRFGSQLKPRARSRVAVSIRRGHFRFLRIDKEGA